MTNKLPYRPFDNLRSSAATNIAKLYTPKEESVWLGHSVDISLRHYQQVIPFEEPKELYTDFYPDTMPVLQSFLQRESKKPVGL